MSEAIEPPVADELASSTRRRMLFFITVLHTCTHIYPCALPPLYLLIRRDLHLNSISSATLLGSLLSVFYCVTSLPLGVLADRYSRKRLLALGLLLNGISFVGLSYAPSYPLVIVCVILAGIAGSFYHPSATALTAGLYPHKKGKAIGFVGVGAAIGFFIGPIYSGWRGEMAGWRAPCLEMGLAGIVMALLFAALSREIPMARVDHSQSDNNSGAVRHILWTFVLIGILFSLRDFAALGVATLTSLFLLKVHHFGEARTGLILGTMSLPALIANPLFGSLSEGKNRLRWLTGLLIAAGIAAMPIPWLPKALVVVGLLIYQFLVLATYPVMESAFADLIPDALRGRVYGVYLASVGIVASSAPWIVGRATDALKQSAATQSAYVPAYAFLGLLTIASILGVWVTRWLKRHRAVVVVGGK